MPSLYANARFDVQLLRLFGLQLHDSGNVERSGPIETFVNVVLYYFRCFEKSVRRLLFLFRKRRRDIRSFSFAWKVFFFHNDACQIIVMYEVTKNFSKSQEATRDACTTQLAYRVIML